MILNNCPFVINICQIGRDKYVGNKGIKTERERVKVNMIINIP